eukprot:6206737-Pleurochrysis_carterae.AAC.2
MKLGLGWRVRVLKLGLGLVGIRSGAGVFVRMVLRMKFKIRLHAPRNEDSLITLAVEIAQSAMVVALVEAARKREPAEGHHGQTWHHRRKSATVGPACVESESEWQRVCEKRPQHGAFLLMNKC